MTFFQTWVAVRRKLRDRAKWRKFDKTRRPHHGRDRYRARRSALLRTAPATCQVCDQPFGCEGPHWDHDHATGKFRGWLCHNCNVALGHVKDSPELLHRLADYVVASGT